jgi:hypothetical protein
MVLVSDTKDYSKAVLVSGVCSDLVVFPVSIMAYTKNQPINKLMIALVLVG